MGLRRTLPVLLVALMLPAAARADLPFSPGATTVTEQPGGNGIIDGGDQISITQSLSSQSVSVTGVNGRLSSQAPGLTGPSSDSTLPDFSFFGDQQANTPPYTADIDQTVACCTNPALTESVTALE